MAEECVSQTFLLLIMGLTVYISIPYRVEPPARVIIWIFMSIIQSGQPRNKCQPRVCPGTIKVLKIATSNPNVPFAAKMLRHSPYPRSHIFTPSSRSSNNARVIRDRKQKQRLSAAYIRDAFDLIMPSSPNPDSHSHVDTRPEVALAKVRRAMKSLADDMSKLDADYTEVREMLQQQKACVLSRELLLQQLQGRSRSLDDELSELNVELLKLDEEIASARLIKVRRCKSSLALD